MNTFIYHVRLKQQWPLGNREILLLFQGIKYPDGSIYLPSKSVELDDVPEDPKILRVNTKSGSYLFEPTDGGRTTKFYHITEVSYNQT